MRIGLIHIEFFIGFLILGLAALWFARPELNVEPLTVFLGAILILMEIIRRSKEHGADEEILVVESPKAEGSPAKEIEFLSAGVGSKALFYQRFGYAFPGVRKITWYEGRAALDRLSILLADPLIFSPGEGRGPPFWWWRGGNLQIESFSRIDNNVALMNWDELKVRRVAAVPNTNYKRCWVYVEVEGMSATGLYEPLSSKDIQERIDEFGYVWEEYALYKGHMIRREEYDDGAANIAGSIVRLTEGAEIRVRYLTPYNFVIAPIASMFNNNEFDDQLESLLNSILKGELDFSQLVHVVDSLPLPRHFE